MDKVNKNDNRLLTKSKTGKRLTPSIYKNSCKTRQ